MPYYVPPGLSFGTQPLGAIGNTLPYMALAGATQPGSPVPAAPGAKSAQTGRKTSGQGQKPRQPARPSARQPARPPTKRKAPQSEEDDTSDDETINDSDCFDLPSQMRKGRRQAPKPRLPWKKNPIWTYDLFESHREALQLMAKERRHTVTASNTVSWPKVVELMKKKGHNMTVQQLTNQYKTVSGSLTAIADSMGPKFSGTKRWDLMTPAEKREIGIKADYIDETMFRTLQQYIDKKIGRPEHVLDTGLATPTALSGPAAGGAVGVAPAADEPAGSPASAAAVAAAPGTITEEEVQDPQAAPVSRPPSELVCIDMVDGEPRVVSPAQLEALDREGGPAAAVPAEAAPAPAAPAPAAVEAHQSPVFERPRPPQNPHRTTTNMDAVQAPADTSLFAKHGGKTRKQESGPDARHAALMEFMQAGNETVAAATARREAWEKEQDAMNRATATQNTTALVEGMIKAAEVNGRHNAAMMESFGGVLARIFAPMMAGSASAAGPSAAPAAPAPEAPAPPPPPAES